MVSDNDLPLLQGRSPPEGSRTGTLSPVTLRLWLKLDDEMWQTRITPLRCLIKDHVMDTTTDQDGVPGLVIRATGQTEACVCSGLVRLQIAGCVTAKTSSQQQSDASTERDTDNSTLLLQHSGDHSLLQQDQHHHQTCMTNLE